MSSIPSPDDRIGDRYRIISLIGEGGMGAVFEAENVITHKRVALKSLHPAVAGRAESAQRLIREAQAASRIRHPNVVDVYDVIPHEGTIFLVLELLEGEPLSAVIERADLHVPAFVSLLLQAMRGVAAAHAQGVIHRDVHPGNIFIARPSRGSQPVVKVLDFGISKLDGESTHALTQTGTTMGTPLFMSYEQLCGSRDLDARADIYSFGVILYRALTGHYPYPADTLAELAVQFVTTKPASAKLLRREIPSALDRLVTACVSRDRELRPATLESLIEELEPFAAEDSFRALLSGQDRQIPRLAPAVPVTRQNADHGTSASASVVAPAQTPQVARPVTPARPASAPPVSPAVSAPPMPRARPRWQAPAAFGLLLLVLAAGSALLASRLTKPPIAAPALPQRPVIAAAAEPAATAPDPIPAGVVSPHASAPTPTGAKGIAPAEPGRTPKPQRVFMPKPKAKETQYWRSGKPLSADEFNK